MKAHNTPYAVILAAGRGERMRPLTDVCPKPLLKVRGKPLIVWHLERLAAAGVKHVVVNTAWLESQFEPLLGDGSAWGLSLQYSHEGERFGGALETAGGIATALPLLGGGEALTTNAPFWVLAGDVFMPDFAFSADDAARFAAGSADAHIYLVPNPAHNLRGDFGLTREGLAVDPLTGANAEELRWTYSTVGLFRPALFAATPPGQKAALAPLLRAAMPSGRVSAGLYSGAWTDVGTPERLEALNALPWRPRQA
jgi:MurNAc alpha-1-phosphate uridylyltransferase